MDCRQNGKDKGRSDDDGGKEENAGRKKKRHCEGDCNQQIENMMYTLFVFPFHLSTCSKTLCVQYTIKQAEHKEFLHVSSFDFSYLLSKADGVSRHSRFDSRFL